MTNEKRGSRSSGSSRVQKRGVEPFAFSHAAFHALIRVYSTSTMMLGELMRKQQAFVRKPLPFRQFWYTAPARDDDPKELRDLVESNRSEMPSEFRAYWALLDQYHATERMWRVAMELARVAADEAAIELDRPSTPPLSRVSVDIKRAIQRMWQSVPPARSIGDHIPRERRYVRVLRESVEEINEWIEELRLVASPQGPHLVEDAEGTVRALWAPKRRAPVGRSELTGVDLDILQAVAAVGARSDETSRSIEEIHAGVGGTESDSYVRKRCAALVKSKYLESRKGPSGGHWIVDLGLHALRARGRPTEPTRNSSLGAQRAKGTDRN